MWQYRQCQNKGHVANCLKPLWFFNIFVCDLLIVGYFYCLHLAFFFSFFIVISFRINLKCVYTVILVCFLGRFSKVQFQPSTLNTKIKKKLKKKLQCSGSVSSNFPQKRCQFISLHSRRQDGEVAEVSVFC
ncbi:hypothetical protein ACOSP7_008432 [Xanthoceras sorbifolium]